MALDSTASQLASRWHQGLPNPLDMQALLPWWAQQSLHTEAWGEVGPRDSQGPSKPVESTVFSLPPAEAGGRRGGRQQSVQIGG